MNVRMLLLFAIAAIFSVASGCGENSAITSVKNKLESELADPASVQYKNIRIVNHNANYYKGKDYLPDESESIMTNESDLIHKAHNERENALAEEERVLEKQAWDIKDPDRMKKFEHRLDARYERKAKRKADLDKSLIDLKERYYIKYSDNDVGVCLEYNAKNLYGGYTGFKTEYCFILDKTHSVICESEHYLEMCL